MVIKSLDEIKTEPGLYILTCIPTGKKYVGQTINLRKRILSYRRNKNYSQIKIFRAIQHFGFDQFSIEVFPKYLSSEELRKLEFNLISELNTYHCGLNASPGQLVGVKTGPKKINEKQIQEFAALYSDGYSLNKIGVQYGCSGETVRRYLTRDKVSLRKNTFQPGRQTKFCHNTINELFLSGKSVSTIASKLGCKTNAVYKALHKSGVRFQVKPKIVASVVFELYNAGLSQKDIAIRLGCSQPNIQYILTKNR